MDKSLGPEIEPGEAIYFIKDLKEEPAPHVEAGFFRQVYGERSMYLNR